MEPKLSRHQRPPAPPANAFVRGEVVCNDIANSRAVQRFVQKWIGRWIASTRPQSLRDASYFHVRFGREGSGHTISCEIRLRLGQEIWAGANFGENLSEALKRGLAHMSPKTA